MKRQQEPSWRELEDLAKAGGLDLDRLCELLRLDRRGWMAYPPLRSLVPPLAVQVLATRLRDTLGLTWSGAYGEACGRLGMNPESLKRQMRRAMAQTKRRALRGADKLVTTLSRDFPKQVA